MKAFRHLVKHAINKGLTVSVYDGEEWSVKRSTNQKEIFEAINSVEESQLRFRDAHGNNVGWALIIDFVEEPENSVVDHTDNEWLNQWSTLYSNEYQ